MADAVSVIPSQISRSPPVSTILAEGQAVWTIMRNASDERSDAIFTDVGLNSTKSLKISRAVLRGRGLWVLRNMVSMSV